MFVRQRGWLNCFLLGADSRRTGWRVASPPLARKGPSLNLRIFLVEDSDIIRSNLSETLLELGNAQVVAHAIGESEARAWLGTHRRDWDLAVVDLFLKEGSGMGVLSSQRERQAAQKIVVLSNYATCDMRSRCAALGADAVFDKSTELDDLIDYCLGLRVREHQDD